MSGAPKTVPIPRTVTEQWRSLTGNGSAAAFHPDMVKELPETARRWLLHSIETGTRLCESAELTMHGGIKLNGNWLPFTAHQILAPARGFIWAARARMRGLTISGYDRYSGGTGSMQWRLLGLIPVMTVDGEDVGRRALGRLAGEGVLVPTAFGGATWRAGSDAGTVIMSRAVDGQTEEVELSVAADGRLTDVLMSRWGDPDGTGFGRFPFGVHVDQERRFAGVTVPARFRAGWWKGTGREADGEFFRAEITSARFR
jgi:hypothetical protein